MGVSRWTSLILAFLLAGPNVASGQALELPPLIPATQEAMLSGQQSVRVDRLKFVGNTAFSDSQLLAAPAGDGGRTVADFLGRELSMDELEQIRVGLTLAYVNAGYINSGARIPDQPVPADGELLVEIVEGRLTDIHIEGRKWLREGYLVDRLRRAARPPLNLGELKNSLEILRQDPKLRRLNADLRPGTSPGEAVLNVAIDENFPGSLALLFSNRRPPSVGAERFEVLAGWNNLSGRGDALSLRYGLNKGDLDDWEWAGLDDFTISYSLPLTPIDTTLMLELERSDTTIVEPPFDQLDLETESTRAAVTVRQPVYRTANTEFALSLGLSVQQVTNRLAGERTNIAPGAIAGETNVTAIRFGQEFSTRSTRQAISLRSTFSLGIDAFDSNISGGDIPDSRFFAWLGQVQYVRRVFEEGNTQLVVRVAGQFSFDELLGPEQFAIGGIDTVRGYRENQLVRDNGVVASVELRIPLIDRKTGGEPILQFAPFIDAGYAFNRRQDPDGEYLISIGAGLIFNPIRNLNAVVYYGRHLNDVSDDSGNLQDHGIHFAVTLKTP
ncbi:MAG: BamA/TamA family outer membrane protein [Phycisphaerae bacterium]|nr:BamA/TamA family outer membrane protein [Phycisphaerae bacterium]MDW8263152.1 ShlB/FhaC/HecB family hemolysin secretion/activation protein [Phycisphaerales bacterium]